MDSLRRRVLERDKLHNSAREMRATARPVETRRICFDCRQTPDPVGYRQKWLLAHPLPPYWCLCSDYMHDILKMGDGSEGGHQRWHEDVYAKANMPPFATLTGCQYCEGRLIEVAG